MSAPLSIRAERVLAPEERCAPPGELLELTVDRGVISGIASVPAAAPPAEGRQTIGGPGIWAMPGVVNAHTHLAMSLLVGAGADLPLMRWLREAVWPREARLTPEDVYWGSLLGIAEGLAAGTTWFSDMYLHEDQVAEAALTSGVRADLAVGLAGEGADYRAKLDRAADLCRAYEGAGDGRVTMRLGPHATYTCTEEALAATAARARAEGLGVHIHLSETAEEVRRSIAATGRTPVAVARDAGLLDVPVVAAHMVHPSREDLPLLAAMRGGVAHCPGSNLQLGSGMAPAPAMAEAGVTVAIGTDGPASAPSLDPWRAMRLAWLLPKGVTGDASAPPAADVLHWATAGGAAALGKPRMGRLSQGAPADVVLLDMSGPWQVPEGQAAGHLLGRASPAEVRAVMVAGRVLFQDGRCLTIDLERVRRECAARARRLFG